MWFRRENETDQVEGDIDWVKCYDNLYIRDDQVEAVPPRAVHTPGRCNRDLTCEDVFNECLDKIRQTCTFWLPLANMFNPGLAKVDLAGKGKTRVGENSVGFQTGADTDRF